MGQALGLHVGGHGDDGRVAPGRLHQTRYRERSGRLGDGDHDAAQVPQRAKRLIAAKKRQQGRQGSLGSLGSLGWPMVGGRGGGHVSH